MGSPDQSFFLILGLKVTMILAAAGAAARALSRRSAALRHLVWTSGLLGALLLPVLSVLVPRWTVSVPPSIPGSGVVFRSAATPAAYATVAHRRNAAAPPLAPAGSGGPKWPVLLWACGAVLFFIQLAWDFWRVARLQRTAPAFPGFDLSLWMRAFGMRRPVKLLRLRAGCMPMASGVFRPAVLLPADAVSWSGERQRVVVLHELAHIRRGDVAMHWMARAALSLYWWNPLAWIAWRGFLKERECAADDMVLNTGSRASDYAGHLLEIARSLQLPALLGSGALGMARRSQLERRLAAILDSGADRRMLRPESVALAAVLVIAAGTPFAALRAQDRTATLPADVDATIRAAAAQKNSEMVESAAKAAELLQQYDLARRLLDSSLTIRAGNSGSQSVEYGVGLVKLGDLERSRGNLNEADAFYTKAVSVLGSRPQAAPALIHLGSSAWKATKDPQSARDFFQRAQAADPAHAGPALMWMALIESDAAQAEDLFKRAQALAFPGSAEQALTMELFSSFLARQNRAEEAKSMQEQARSARIRLGAQSVEVRRPSGVTAVEMGPGIAAPKLLFKVEPQYTEEARLAKYEGTVVVSAEIGAGGQAQSMRVIRGLGLGLEEQALKAIGQWKFQPAMKEGRLIPVKATIEVNFRLL
ncbi:MAG TPA: TonB family protein [Bryobacteraceae bacterium]|nr:TonB family protein [Bryobacteraceae bacterium]